MIRRAPLMVWPLLLALALTVSCSSTSGPGTAEAPETPTPAPWTDEDRELALASFDQVWETIREHHYDPDMNGIDWEGARDELRPLVENATSPSEVRSVIFDLFDRLGESHYGIVPSRAYESVESDEPEASGSEAETGSSKPASTADSTSDRDGEATSAPHDGDGAREESDAHEAPKKDVEGRSGIIVRVVDGAAVVVEASGPAERAGVQRGWAIARIGSREITDLFATLESEDPDQERLLEESAVMNRLQGDVGDALTVEFDSPTGRRTIDVVLEPVDGTPIRTGFMPALTLELDDRLLESNIGYFRFNLFIDPNRLTPAFTSAVERFIEVGAPGVIIDLRGNPGGIGILASAMSGWFLEESGRSMGTMKMRSGDMRFMVFPQPDPYRGKLAVLIDGQSGSTSEIFAGGLQDLGRARIFGLRSAGAALPSVFEKLPNGDGFQYAIADFLRPNGTRLEGIGVEPDEEVGYDREVLLSGRDPMIDAAARWILDETKTD